MKKLNFIVPMEWDKGFYVIRGDRRDKLQDVHQPYSGKIAYYGTINSKTLIGRLEITGFDEALLKDFIKTLEITDDVDTFYAEHLQ